MGDFQVEGGITREGGRRFCLRPKSGGTIHGTRGNLFEEAGTSFREVGMSALRNFILRNMPTRNLNNHRRDERNHGGFILDEQVRRSIEL